MIGWVTDLQITPTVERRLEQYRGELTGYCYRMLGSTFEAEDAVQETMVRAWKSIDRFEGRAALRSWLYRIATNVCLDALNGRQRRARPMDLGPAGSADAEFHGGVLPEAAWLEPMPDTRVLPEDGDPAELAASRETLRLAFVNALQHLPPRQRAVLILREVLRWQASEVAELLDTSVASVNSALQRARAQLSDNDLTPDTPVDPLDDSQRELLDRYVAAFEQYDMDALTSLLQEDATLSMPPFDLWLQGTDQIRTWFLGHGIDCKGSRLLPVNANGSPGFAQYRPSPNGGWEPWALQVLEISDGRIAHLNSFLDTHRLFPLFGLPDRLDA
jgi:RNA polymerase sigma-70 factor (ECF subfamily)